MGAIEARALFRERFGSEPEIVVSAPGRINLIGEHTDYSGGWVLPMAIDRAVTVAASPSGKFTEVVSAELGLGDPFITGDLGYASATGWAKYPAGVGWALGRALGRPPCNLLAAVQSDLPMGSGLSSSAALEVAFGLAWSELDGLSLSLQQIAQIAQQAENDFVGMRCGIMDQMASAISKARHAMLLDTMSLEVAYVPIPEGVSILVCDTSAPHTHQESGYNDRRTECEAALRILGLETFRACSPEDLLTFEPELGDTLFRRARHIITENARCHLFATALRRGELAALGPLMKESHWSLRDDYNASSNELDAMQAVASDAPGCIGVRMTGGGFGGACVAIVEASHAQRFVESTAKGYSLRTGRTPVIDECRAESGAKVIDRTDSPQGMGQ